MALGRTIFQSFVVLRQPGTWGCLAAMLAPGQTSPLATKYKETVKITVCISSWSKFCTKRYKKTKNPTATSEEQKQGIGSKSRVLHMSPALNATRGMGNPPKPPLQPDPWTHPTLTP